MTIDDRTPLMPDDGDESQEQTMTVQPTALMTPPLSQSWLPAPATSQPAAAGGMSFFVYLHALRRHWIAALASGLVLGTIAAVTTWLVRGPEYYASAALLVQPTEKKIVFDTVDTRGSNQAGEFELYKETQVARLKDRFVIMSALRNQRVKGLASIQREEQRHNALQWLTNQLRVQSTKNTQIIQVGIALPDPIEAAVLVNAIVQAYFDEVINLDQDQRRSRFNELQQLYAENEQRAQTKRESLKDLTERLGTAETEALSVKQQIAIQQFAEYRRELTRLQFELSMAKGHLQSQQAALDRLPSMEISEYEVLAMTQADPRYKVLGERMVFQDSVARQNQNLVVPGQATKFIDRATRDYGTSQAQFEEMQKNIRERIRGNKRTEIERDIRRMEAEVAILNEQERQLQKDVDQQRKEVDQLGRGSLDVEMMRAEQRRTDMVLNSIAEERERLRIELRAKPRVAVIKGQQEEPAQVPDGASNQGVRVGLTLLAALAGLMLPSVGFVLWDVQSNRISAADEVSRGLGLPIIGSVPKIPANVIRQLGSPTKRNEAWRARLTESVDGLVARLLRKAELEQTRVILVSSAVAGEGKTTLATQVAMSLARNMRRTVLVDFDLRRPALNTVFDLPLESGVCEALRGQADVSNLVQPSGMDMLSVITAGRWDRQVLAALGNGAAGSLLQELRADYDFVIVDSSPVLPVADTRLVSQYVDMVILSVFRDVSQGPKVLAAHEILEAFGAENIETVMTGGQGHFYAKNAYGVARLPQPENASSRATDEMAADADPLGGEQ